MFNVTELRPSVPHNNPQYPPPLSPLLSLMFFFPYPRVRNGKTRLASLSRNENFGCFSFVTEYPGSDECSFHWPIDKCWCTVLDLKIFHAKKLFENQAIKLFTAGGTAKCFNGKEGRSTLFLCKIFDLLSPQLVENVLKKNTFLFFLQLQFSASVRALV